MKYRDYEALMEALSLNNNASEGYDEYPEEDMESITFYESDEEETMINFDTKSDYEEVTE